jgi:hypothetical protein
VDFKIRPTVNAATIDATPYATGTITVPTEYGLALVSHLKLAGSERLTIAGTGRVAIQT